MPRGGKGAARSSDSNADDDGGSSPPFSKDLEQRAVRALLQAVEDPAHNNNSNKRPFLNLFHLQCSNAFTATAIREGLSAREQRRLLFQSLRNLRDGPAARFFPALHRLVEHAVENQEHVPESAFVDDDGRRGGGRKPRDCARRQVCCRIAVAPVCRHVRIPLF